MATAQPVPPSVCCAQLDLTDNGEVSRQSSSDQRPAENFVQRKRCAEISMRV